MKKILSILLALACALTLFVGCTSKPQVTVKVEKDGKVQLEETFKTDIDTLENLLIKETEKLGCTLQDSEYGKFITGMNNYTADSSKNEFWEVIVNDVSSQVGIKEIKITNGDVYTFKLSTF